MAILKMEKFNLVCFKQDRTLILKELQNFLDVDFRNIELEDFTYPNLVSKEKGEAEDIIYKIETTLKKLRRYSETKTSFKTLREGKKNYTYDELEKYVKNCDWETKIDSINEILNINEQYKKMIESKTQSISEYSKWKKLDVSEKDLKRFKNVKVLIGSFNKKYKNEFLENVNEIENLHFEILGEDKKSVFIFSIILNENIKEFEEFTKKYGFNRINLNLKDTPKNIIRKHEVEILKMKEKISENIEEIKKHSEDINMYETIYEYYRNVNLKEEVSEKFVETEELILISGYFPSEKKVEFEKIIKDICNEYYYLKIEEVEKDSREVPIKLKNSKLVSPFESLTSTYSLPKYNEIDPTPFVAPFFWLFFGMMVADAGYGLIMFLISGLVLLSFNLGNGAKSVVKFFFILSTSVIFWGILYGSYFGMGIPGMWRLVDPGIEYNKILVWSIIFGVIHVYLGLSVKAGMQMRDGKYLDALYDVGLWFLTLTSVLILLSASYIGITGIYLQIAKWVMIISMIGIVLTGGREIKNVGGRLGLGLYALYGITGYMGDLISYARLMALGLSGGFIAVSINMISRMLMGKWYYFIFVAIIFVAGHSFNMLLSMLGAYVHSSRLIYVEFFGKFYEGGGKPFKEFKIKEKYINIKEKN